MLSSCVALPCVSSTRPPLTHHKHTPTQQGTIPGGVRGGLMELFYGVYNRDADRCVRTATLCWLLRCAVLCCITHTR